MAYPGGFAGAPGQQGGSMAGMSEQEQRMVKYVSVIIADSFAGWTSI